MRRAWPLVVLLSSSCLDFNKVVGQYCDAGAIDGCPELNCANGLDDDGDQLTDCADPDCLGLPCQSSDLCAVATVCQAGGGCGGSPKQCNMPPAFCLATPGTCDPGSGACSYTPDPTGSCDDSNACTSNDSCMADGGCLGSPVTCNSPPSVCFGASTGCDPVRGCLYQVQTGAACNDTNPCTFNDGCRADGGCSGTAYTCPATECASSACLGDGGCAPVTPRTGQPCDAGLCLATGACSTFPYGPANFDPAAIAARGIAPALTINCTNAWFNSTDGGHFWCSGQSAPTMTVITQGGGPDAVVLATSGLVVGAGASLTLGGTRPVIFAVWGDATIDGTITAASSNSIDAGAGRNPAGLCDAQDGLADGILVGGGGGGGGHGTRGGDGGDGDSVARGGRSGSISGNAAITPLRGGCPGGSAGRGADPSGLAGYGGAGGGAVQVSASGLLTVSGTVTASGAAGQGGLGVLSGSNGGGGGGSGGAVLLEGQDVLVPASARLTSNGGGGGGGGGIADGSVGLDGPTTTATPAPGGGAGLACAGKGGQGGAAQGPAAPGENGALCSAGGGGGGVGRIRVNGFGGCRVDAGVQSPVPAFGGVCP